MDNQTTTSGDWQRSSSSNSVTLTETPGEPWGARADIHRSAGFRTADSDGFTLEGIAAVFDTPTRIRSWEGDFIETLDRNAFDRTLREDRSPVMMFNHGHHPFVGDIPIASIETIEPRDEGLFVRARMFDNDLVKPVRDAIAGDAINGMSFMFNVLEDERSTVDGTEHRHITDLRMHELGPVVFPAYDETSVGVRSYDPSAYNGGIEDGSPEGTGVLSDDNAIKVRPHKAALLRVRLNL